MIDRSALALAVLALAWCAALAFLLPARRGPREVPPPPDALVEGAPWIERAATVGWSDPAEEPDEDRAARFRAELAAAPSAEERTALPAAMRDDLALAARAIAFARRLAALEARDVRAVWSLRGTTHELEVALRLSHGEDAAVARALAAPETAGAWTLRAIERTQLPGSASEAPQVEVGLRVRFEVPSAEAPRVRPSVEEPR